MKSRNIQYIIGTIVLVLLLPINIFAKPPINIHVSILPQKYFVERIGKDHVKVDVLVKPGKNPSTYSPSPDQIKHLMSCDVYFRIGMPFENGILHKIKSMTGAMIVDTRNNIKLRKMKSLHSHDNNETHNISGHDPDEKEQHGAMGKDPHIWMNPLMVKTQALTIFQTLSSIDPDNRHDYKKNYTLFAKDLDELDHHLKTILKKFKGKNLFVFHPSFGYFTDAYGLEQIAIETMGKAPKGKTLSTIIKLAKQQNAEVIFVQPQFDRNTAVKIATAINGEVVPIDPLAYDYPVNMKIIAKTIAKALRDE